MDVLNKYDENFWYYLFGTFDLEKMSTIFNDGLQVKKENNLSNISFKIDMREIKKDFKSFLYIYCLQYNFKYCYIVKIPKCYMGYCLPNQNHIEPPIPIWIPTLNLYNKNEYILTPCLIEGVYFLENNEIISNSNFNIIYNPTGMIYDKSQLKNIENCKLYCQNADYWYNFAYNRNYGYSHRTIKEIDVRDNFWKDYNNYYQNMFVNLLDKEKTLIKKI